MALPGLRPRGSTCARSSRCLAFNSIPGPLTIFDGVRKLSRATCCRGSPGAARAVQQYAQVTPAPAEELRGESAADLADELRERLRDSVRAHLVSDVPVGVLLSGGVDSATLAALAAEESGERVRTFSIGFGSARSTSSSGRAWWRARYDTDHHELIVRAGRGGGAARARGGLRRAAGGLVGAADLPRLPARVAARQGCAFRRGRRRAVRRLPHLRGGLDRAVGGRPAAALRPLVRAAAELVRRG